MYSDDDFAMRLVSAFEAVLDPLVATLDNLAEHFDAAYAPRDVLELLSDWLALERDEQRSGEERRRILQRAPELMRLRGTRAGIELALELAFPDVPFRVRRRGRRPLVARSRRGLDRRAAVVRRLLRYAAAPGASGRGGAR